MSRPKVLISAERIAQRVVELAQQIQRDYAGKSLVVIPILKGSFMFAADLIRQLDLDVSMDFLGVQSYGNDVTSTGVVKITHDLQHPIADKHILLLEDIVDTGLTLVYLKENLLTRGPASLRTAALLSKPARRTVPANVDYLGFEIEDVFAVGYGLDFAQKYRGLPYVGALDTTALTAVDE